MIPSHGYAATDAKSPLRPFEFERQDIGPTDVLIGIAYCGICHSDIHQVRNEWGSSNYPMVPGHEIVGTVLQVGNQVKKFKTGDLAGVGCFVGSCRTCESCKDGCEQYCEKGFVGTYNSVAKDGTRTMGGYSNNIVVDESFTLKVPANLELAAVAPLLCAGITTYSPLRHWKVGKGHRIGIMGLGGLGHMAIKLANAMGAHVVVFTTSPQKVEDALQLGAKEVVISKNPNEMQAQANRFDLILNTISAPIDLGPYLQLLKRDGTMVLLGVPPKDPVISTANLVFQRRAIAGSLVGGLPETQ
ncbi:MAG TPA: NAD(P)-dependent alcohol dehydrogenase, partial [Candidatus Berkiella sp.]|nr:NAD(P)-dependent alcohol dehydrogenase [Candidatus Berkiella sp.]